MWHIKKWGKVGGWLVVGLFLMSWLVPLMGQADTMTDVMSGPMYVKSYGSSIGPGASIQSYPTLDTVTANNTDNGRLTTSTTQITIKLEDSITFSSSVKYRFSHFYFDVFTAGPSKGDSGTSLTTTTSNLTDYGNGQNSISFGSGKTQTLNVDLSKLGEDLPVYIGFRLTTQSGDVSTYYLGSFNENSDAGAALTPTITGNLKASDTTITGTGTNVGDAIFTTINNTRVRTTVGADKTYKLDLGSTLAGVNTVTVYESNNVGDKGSVKGSGTSKSLNLTSTATTADTYPDDLAGFSSDSDVISWLVKTVGLKAAYSDNSSTDGVTFAADMTDLTAKLKALGDGGTLAIPVYAQDSSLKSDPVTITVTKHAGRLTFGTISNNIGFGNLQIPTAETIFQPSAAWDVNVSDTRVSGSAWYVYATATTLTSDKHTLAGNLVYKDGSTETPLNANSTLIEAGKKVAGTTNTAITDDWSSTKGIMLAVQPGVYAGNYTGAVNWSLQDTPVN